MWYSALKKFELKYHEDGLAGISENFMNLETKWLKFIMPLAICGILAGVQAISSPQASAYRSPQSPANSLILPAKIASIHSDKSIDNSPPPAPQQNQQQKILSHRLGLLRKLFDAIREVESHGDDRAVGDGGLALGPYQITKDYWSDACKQGRVNWDYSTLVWSRRHSEQIMLWYWRRYCPESLDNFYQTGDPETLSRVHNGGPTGMGKSATIRYWREVRTAILQNELPSGEELVIR